MANWWERLTNPMVPEGAIQGVQNFIDDPNAESRNPLLAFGAGALEGLRGMTTPLDAVGAATGLPIMRGMRGLARAAEVAPEAAQGLQRAMSRIGSVAGDTFGIHPSAARRSTAVQTPPVGRGTSPSNSTGYAEFDLPEESVGGYQSFGNSGRYNGPERRKTPR